MPLKNVSDKYEKREETISETELDDVIQGHMTCMCGSHDVLRHVS